MQPRSSPASLGARAAVANRRLPRRRRCLSNRRAARRLETSRRRRARRGAALALSLRLPPRRRRCCGGESRPSRTGVDSCCGRQGSRSLASAGSARQAPGSSRAARSRSRLRRGALARPAASTGDLRSCGERARRHRRFAGCNALRSSVAAERTTRPAAARAQAGTRPPEPARSPPSPHCVGARAGSGAPVPSARRIDEKVAQPPGAVASRGCGRLREAVQTLGVGAG